MKKQAQKSRLQHGFTLVEMLVALVVGIIAIGAVYSVYIAQQKEYCHQQLRVAMHQNLRGAMTVLEQEIRMIGFDPEATGQFGITDVRRYDLITTSPNPAGQPALFYSVDLDENGAPDMKGRLHYNGDPYNKEFANFRIRDDQKMGRRYLAWDNGDGRWQLAENVEQIGFAYAIDADGDGRRDTWGAGPFPIWAVDTDNDNLLDTHLDTNDDGIIDERDDQNNDLRITAADGCPLNPPISLDHIRSVRVWLLAVSALPMKGHVDRYIYVVGDRIVRPPGDGSVRRILETVVERRNL